MTHTLAVGDRVHHIEDTPEKNGTVVEIYTGSKPLMRGLVKVDWHDDGTWSWEVFNVLVKIPKVAS